MADPNIMRRHAPLGTRVQDGRRLPRSFVWSWIETGRAWLSLIAWTLGLLAFWRLAETQAVQGYEVSIYYVVSPLFWGFLLSSLVLHIVVAASACFGRDPTDVDQVAAISGIAGVAINTIFVLLLPYLHGYLSISDDISSHISRSVEIATEWGIPSDVFYPGTYALVEIIHVMTGLGVRDIWFLGVAGVYILYILFCLLVTKKFSKDNRSMLFAGLVGAVPVAGAYLRTIKPISTSVRLLPLLIYLYFNSRREKSLGFNLLLILLLILFPFIHPLTALLSVLWLTLLEVAIHRLVRRHGDEPPLAMAPSMILTIVWFTWFSSFVLWNRSVKNVVNWLGGEARTQLSKVGYLIGRSGMSSLESVLLVLKTENGLIIYVGLALATLLLYYFPVNKNGPKRVLPRYLGPIYVLLAVSLVAAVASLVGPFGNLDIYRFSRFLVPWATLIIALVPMLGSRIGSRGNLLVGLLVTFALLLTAVGGILALHPSPYVFLPNDQMTVYDTACMEWFTQQGKGQTIKGIWSVKRLAHVVLGYNEARSLMDVMDKPLPDHFGYDQFPYVAAALVEPTYILIIERDRTAVLGLWASVNKYTEEDFRRLEMDPSVILLYSNGQCEIWTTRP